MGNMHKRHIALVAIVLVGHRGARCVHLRLTWDNGTILQEFPPVTL